MPRYKLIIEKELLAEYWVNDYHFTADDMADADSKAQPIIDAEIAVHNTAVLFTMYRISTVTPDDGIFTNFSLNTHGTLADDSGLLALWNVLRVDFPAVNGRSGRKYLRGVLSEIAVSYDIILPTPLGIYDTNYALPLRALDYLEKASGVLINDCVVNSKVGMRQLRRGSKRRVTPIIS